MKHTQDTTYLVGKTVWIETTVIQQARIISVDEKVKFVVAQTPDGTKRNVIFESVHLTTFDAAKASQDNADYWRSRADELKTIAIAEAEAERERMEDWKEKHGDDEKYCKMK